MNISDREHASLNCDEDAGWRATTKYKNITKQHSYFRRQFATKHLLFHLQKIYSK